MKYFFKPLRGLPLLLSAVLTLFVASPAIPQAVDLQGLGRLKLPVLAGGVRKTNENFSTTYTPFWHRSLLTDEAVDSAADLTLGLSFNYSLTNRCSVPPGAPTGTISFSDVSGSYPAGITRTGGTISGSPTTAQTTTPTIRCTFTPDAGSATITDQGFSFHVLDPDTAAPTVPANLSVTPASSTSLTVTWLPSIDPSGILSYGVVLGTSESNCNSSTPNFFTVFAPEVTHTYTGLTANTTYWAKVQAKDDSAARNVSAYTACVSGTTSSAGTALIFNEGFETVTVPTSNSDTSHPLFRASNTGQDANNFAAVSTLHAREGAKSLRSKLTKSGVSNYRQELTVKTSLSTTAITGSEDYWFGESTYIPSASSTTTRSVRWQWHTWGTDCCSPVWGLRVSTSAGYEITQEGTASNANIAIGTAATNEWTDWVVQIRWRQDTNGYIKIWKNGTLVVNRTNDQTAPTAGSLLPFLKIGLYGSGWNQSGNSDSNGTVQEQFQDSLRICYGNNCTFSDVAPQGNRLTAP